jgi:transcriptional regulator with XRE-family HTH domain
MLPTDLPARLRLLRLQSGLTQRELARRICACTCTVSRWERGQSPIDQRTALAYQSVCRNARQSRRRRNRAAGSGPRPFPLVSDAPEPVAP